MVERLEGIMKRLSLEDVSIKYPGSTDFAVQNINFSLEKGEIVGLLGHNGAGKTTTLECLAGLIQPTEGIRKNGLEKTNGKIIYIPADMYMYNMLTVEETLLFVGRLHGLSKKEILRDRDYLLSTFNLREQQHVYTKNLSFGMKNKLALITGVLANPQVLMLDEPMTGFDALSTRQTKDFLLKFMNDSEKTILLSSHRLDIIEDICQRILVINKGQLVFEGSVSTLKEQQSINSSLEAALLQLTQHPDVQQNEDPEVLQKRFN